MPRVILGVKLYSIQETAELLGLTVNSVYSYIRKGRIQATVIGGKKYFSEEGLKQFLTATAPPTSRTSSTVEERA